MPLQSKASPAARIEICGGIASGKTTLALAIGQLGFQTALERFSENPFLAKFYADPRAYAFETELTFLLQHFSQIREVSHSRLAVDFALALDLAYAKSTLTDTDRTVFESVLDRALHKVEQPSLIVRLVCNEAVELERIRARKRPSEQAISLTYLEQLDAAIDWSLNTFWFRDTPVLRIDSAGLDFRPDGIDRDAVCRRVLEGSIR